MKTTKPVALVTGASSGIGAVFARKLSARGFDLILVARRRDRLELLASELGGAGVLVADLAVDADLRRVEEHIAAEPNLEFLVNNAGYTWDAVIHKMTDDQWEAMLKVHLTGPFRLIRAAAPFFRDAAKEEKAAGKIINRKIINISSTSGTRGNAGQANYSSAKAGIVGLSRTLAKEWGPMNIQVNAVAYGWIDTRLTREKEKGEAIEREGKQVAIGIPDAMRKAMTMVVPMGRPGTPEEAAGPVLFLASPLSDYVSGQCVEVTGGL